MTAKELSLKDYVEGRFDRLIKDIDNQLKMQQDEFLILVNANDLRYQQRFDAQGKALDAAFGAAKGAVDAALAASDKAAVKSELSADKRFADLGDLIREQFKGMSEKFDALVRRVESIEGRINTSTGEVIGGKQTKEDSGRLWSIVIAAGGILLALWALLK